MSVSLRPVAMLLAATAVLVPALRAAQPQTTVGFAPALAASMKSYGESERSTLEQAADGAVAHAMRAVTLPAGSTIQVTFEELAPSHPTRAQQLADPAEDPIGTHLLGGAALTGVVRDASGRVLTRVEHRYFPLTLRLGSASLDPWADARIAIDQFAIRLAAACRDLRTD
jgi:ABC-type uncharacterized transport system permease subunit